MSQQPTERCSNCNGSGIVPGSAGEYTIDDCARCQKTGRVAVPWQTTIINLWGGPGSGKSTTAAAVFAAMKMAGHSAELVTEYVKMWAWRGERIGAFDDVYITAKQLRRESSLYGRVEYIVTDSPLSLGQLYERLYKPDQSTMADLCASLRARQAAAGLRVVDVFIRRMKPYVAAGRWEDESAARKIDAFAKELLVEIAEADGSFRVVDGTPGAAAEICQLVGVGLAA